MDKGTRNLVDTSTWPAGIVLFVFMYLRIYVSRLERKPFLNQSHVQSAPCAPISEKVMPQLQRNVPNQNPPPLQQSPSHKTPPKVQPSPFLDIPQTDGVIDLDQLSSGIISENNDDDEDNEDSDFDISDDDAPLLPEMGTETGDTEKRPKKPRAAYGSLKKKKITPAKCTMLNFNQKLVS